MSIISLQPVNPTNVELDFDIVRILQNILTWFVGTWKNYFLPLFHSAWHWFVAVLSSPGRILHGIFEHPSEWPAQIGRMACALLTAHPHIVHITSFTIFFGPIVFLLPLLFLHELVILLLFNFSFFLHGMVPGSNDRYYSYLRSSLTNTRDSTFATIETTAASYNKWTTDNIFVLAFRLIGLIVGCFALYTIWNGVPGC